MIDTIFSHPLVASAIAAFLLVGIIGKIMRFSFERIARWYLYISAFAAVIVMDSIFFPFIGGKDYFFRFATELALASMMLWWAFEAKSGELTKRLHAAFKKPMVWGVTAFFIAFELASVFAYDFYSAFWSNYERGEGGFQMIHYYIFFILLVVLFTEEKQWKNLFRFSLISAGLMILYGIGGNYSVEGFIGPYTGSTAPTGFWHKLFDGRFEGSLGNPAYVDPYLIFSMFYVGYLWIGSKIKGTLGVWKSVGFGAMIAIFFLFFILGQTRGAFLGLDVGIFVLLGYLVFKEDNKFIRKLSSAVVLIGALIAFFIQTQVQHQGFLSSVVSSGFLGINIGILVFLVALAFSMHKSFRFCFRIILGVLIVLAGIGFTVIHDVSQIENIPAARVLQISTSDTTAQTRFWVWSEAWKGFLARPVLGWGPENFSVVFDKYFDPRFYIPNTATETWFDRAHSIYFDYLAETGLLGLLSYLSIFFAFYWQFFREAHKKSRIDSHGELMNIEKGLMIALPVAYLIQGLAIFDVFPMYYNLFLFFAFSTYYFSIHKK